MLRMTDDLQQRDPFSWGELGEKFWRQANETVRATERQLKFAAALYQGAGSYTAAARLAGYTERGKDDVGFRTTASRAAQTDAVKELLALANAEKPGRGAGAVDGAEIDREIDRMIRGRDPAAKIKGIELWNRREERRAELGRRPDDDGFSEDRLVRDFLLMPNGGPAIVQILTGQGKFIGNFPLLLDVARACQRDDPALWARLMASPMSPRSRVDLQRNLADPLYQNRPEHGSGRSKVWREIGIDIEEQDKIYRANGHHTHADDRAAEPDAEAITPAGIEAETEHASRGQ